MVPTGLADKTHPRVPISTCIYFVCDYEPAQNRLGYDIGPNCIMHMLVELTKLADECIAEMQKNQEMKVAAEDLTNFKNATHCSLCSMPFQRERDDSERPLPPNWII